MKLSENPTISIIIPVYNARDTLFVTCRSLRRQTYTSLEVILVNDGSTDGSLELINKYDTYLRECLDIQVQVLSHSQNRGVAAARNTGLDAATGEYIYFLDADDWIEPDAIELMIGAAIATDADIVGFNWWLSFKQNARKMKQPAFLNSAQAIDWMMIGKMRWNLWAFFVKRNLYKVNSIRFVPGMNMGEDMTVMIKLFSCTNKVTYLNQALYHYGQSNTESLTKVYSEKHMNEVAHNVEELERFLSSKFKTDIIPLINYLKLNIKLPLLISSKSHEYNRWRSWYREANSLATANRQVSLRIRILQWAAANKQDWILRLHYYLVIKLIYGIIYK